MVLAPASPGLRSARRANLPASTLPYTADATLHDASRDAAHRPGADGSDAPPRTGSVMMSLSVPGAAFMRTSGFATCSHAWGARHD